MIYMYISKARCICKWGIICPLCRRFRPHLNRGNYYWHCQNVKKIEDKNINVNNVNVTYINKRKTPSSTLKCSFKALAPAITWSWQTQRLHTASSIQYKLGVNEINKHEAVWNSLTDQWTTNLFAFIFYFNVHCKNWKI